MPQQSRALDSVYDSVYNMPNGPSRYRPGGSSKYKLAVGATKSTAAQVSGANRAKFFKKPVLPILHSVPPEVLLAPVAAAQNSNTASANQEITTDDQPSKSVGIQTTYRDSEAQTAPYTPDFTVKENADGSLPEILSLQSLTQEAGLPVGLPEVEWIERNRAKKAFEASLPPMTDEAYFELRKRMMEAQEMKEWSFREGEIDKLQAERLNLLSQAIVERDLENEFVSEQRVEALRQTRVAEKEKTIERIQALRIKNLRKLSKRRASSSTTTTSKRDVIAEYDDLASKVYAPLARQGKVVLHNNNDSASATRSIASLEALEATLSSSVTSIKIKRPSVNKKSSRGSAAVQENLDRVAARLEAAKKKGSITTTSSSNTNQSNTSTPSNTTRPAAPDFTEKDETLQQTNAALITLQRLIRGRAVQNIMYEGHERRKELIAELRESSEAAAAVHSQQEEEKSVTQNAEYTARNVATGEVLSEMLDYLYKHLGRVRQQAALSKLATDAREERRKREVLEGGRRHAEELLRARRDVVYNATVRVHEETADDYLDELFDTVTSDAATEIATHEAGVRTQVLLPMLATMEGDEEAQDELVIKDLVASFLFPEVERRRVQQQVSVSERRYLAAATESVRVAIKGTTGK